MIEIARRAAALLYRALAAHRADGPVLLPANVCAVVPMTARAAGHRVEFIDLDPSSLDLARTTTLERVRRGRCAGVVFVHPYGALREVASFFAALRSLQPDLLLVDDRCLCPPALDETAPFGQADLMLFSTGRTKYVDLAGGGYAWVETALPRLDDAVYDAAAAADADAAPGLALAGGGILPAPKAGWLDLRAPEHAWTEYRARIAERLPQIAQIKQRLDAIYREGIPAQWPLAEEFCRWRFTIRVPRSAELLQEIFAQGLFASRHYAPAAPLFGDRQRYPVAEALHADVVNLFNDGRLSEAQVARLATIVRRHVGA